MQQNSEKFKITYILIALNIILYVYTSWVGGDFLYTQLNTDVLLLVQVNALVFHGFYWQLITSIFVHASILHLVGNMAFLFIFGLRAEEMFSLPEYLSIYFLGGLAGNFLTLLFLDPYAVSLGASGAIFSLFGAVVIFSRRSVRQSIMGALVYAFFLFFISSGPQVNYFAHFGGLGAGLLIGYFIASRRKPVYSYNVKYSNSPF